MPNHYYDDLEPTPEEIEQGKASHLAKGLRELPSNNFTVNEVALLLKLKWSRFQTHYYSNECAEIFALAERFNIK